MLPFVKSDPKCPPDVAPSWLLDKLCCANGRDWDEHNMEGKGEVGLRGYLEYKQVGHIW